MLGDRGELFGAVASMPTAWRLLERLDAANAPAVGSARPTARATAGAAGAATPAGVELRIDIDATITIAYSEKDAAPTWRRAFGYHPFLAFLDRPDIAGREALPGLLRAGNAGSNSARDYISVLDARPGPTTRRGPPHRGRLPGGLVRTDAAGATHAFVAARRFRGVRFSLGFAVDPRIQRAAGLIPPSCRAPALNTDTSIRDGAWVTEATGMVDVCLA